MKKYLARFILILITVSLLLPFLAIPTHSATFIELPMETIVEEAQEVIIYTGFQYIEQNTSNNCLTKIEQCNSYIAYLFSQETPKVNNEISRVEEIRALYEADYEKLLLEEEEQAIWGEKMSEYPEATQIWRIMKEEFGWSDIVCAGIMGNMMAEVGGGTLEGLNNWDVDGSSGLGLIQWLKGRKKGIKAKYGDSPTLEEQLYYMRDELFGTNGVRKQVSDAQLDAIINASTPEQVAYKFAVYFERCATWARNCRRGYARIAYNYFVD